MPAAVSVPLSPHPSARFEADITARAELSRDGDELTARFVVRGDPRMIRWPKHARPERRDLLWEHTVFEAFVGASGAPGYEEFNVSPSSAWAVYAFDAPRSRTADPLPAPPPHLELTLEPNGWTAVARFAVSISQQAWDVAPAMVLEATDGSLSHWAAVHTGAAPDFHAREGFIVGLDA